MWVALHAAVQSSSQEWQGTTGMGEQQLQVRHFVEHAGANETGDCCGSLEGESQSQEQCMTVAGAEGLHSDAVVRVQEDDEAEALDGLEQREQSRVVQATARNSQSTSFSIDCAMAV